MSGRVLRPLIVMAAAAVILSAATYTVIAAETFKDVESHWAASDLKRAAGDGILKGSSGLIRPNGTLTGAEMAAVLVRQTGLKSFRYSYPGTTLSDWFYGEAAAAADHGFIPYDGSLSMTDPVTRNQVFEALAAAYFTDSYDNAADILIEKGIVKGDENGDIKSESFITRAEFVTMLYRILDADVNSAAGKESLPVEISSISAPDVAAGGSIAVTASFKTNGTQVCDLLWFYDGSPASGYSSNGKTVTDGMTSTFKKSLTFTENMALSHRVGIMVIYNDESTGESRKIYEQTSVTVKNYDYAHYHPVTVKKVKVPSEVSCVYKGNYTSSSTASLDYSTTVKQDFVNAKGYSSKTSYLVWTNLATQKVNVFKGSTGEWKLVKTFRCASGAKSTPTPTGVTYITYKQSGWYTSTYVCKPIVRFYPGTGYAFHSILYTPDGKSVKDGSMGFPASHGCIRMQPAGIQWIYDNVPVNSTVVIY
jgi:lipoprotein-anchoring transpeptidase ErfK/SrfK